MIRLFVSAPLAAGAEVIPSPEQVRYLLAVMRLGVGDAVLLFNGRDGEWRALVIEASKRACRLRVEAQTRPQAQPPDLDLIVALVKRARLETIVEKAAEAAEQTGRLDVPEVVELMTLDRLLDGWETPRRLMFCDEAGDAPDAAWGGETGRAAPALEALRDQPRDLPWAVLIGPEGGFAPEERGRLRSLSFVTPVTLGPRILRADSAAIAALTLWQAALGDWRPAAD
jgi:16S rRNA (uracil1498-N3)-methyltransferase